MSEKNVIWISGGMAERGQGGAITRVLALMRISAVSHDEAYGKAMIAILKHLPKSEGYERHHVYVQEQDSIAVFDDPLTSINTWGKT